LLDTDQKIILLDHQNNKQCCKRFWYSSIFDSISTIIWIVQQNYFSDLYPAKILDLSAKLFFPCTAANRLTLKPLIIHNILWRKYQLISISNWLDLTNNFILVISRFLHTHTHTHTFVSFIIRKKAKWFCKTKFRSSKREQTRINNLLQWV